MNQGRLLTAWGAQYAPLLNNDLGGKEMNLNIRFKGFDSTEAVKHHLIERTRKLTKFLPPTTTLNATLVDDKIRKIVEINLRHKGSDYVAKQASDSLTSSIDEVVDKLLRQLSKAKSKKTDRSASSNRENDFEFEL